MINYDSAEFIKNPDEWQALPGSLEAIANLNQAGYKVVVATNQSGIGAGCSDMSALNAMHEKCTPAGPGGGRVDAPFSARIPPKTTATAASRPPAYWKTSASALAPGSAYPATACAIAIAWADDRFPVLTGKGENPRHRRTAARHAGIRQSARCGQQYIIGMDPLPSPA